MKIKNSHNIITYIIFILISFVVAFSLGTLNQMGIFASIGILVGLIVAFYIFKNPYLGMLLIFFFLPFERIPSIDLGFMSVKINQMLGAITLFSWFLSLVVKDRKIRPVAIMPSMIILYIGLIISLVNCYYFPRSFTVFIFILFTSSLALLVPQFIDTKDKLHKVFQVIFYSTIIVTIFSVFQFLGDLIGLPTEITGLDEAYTKAIFGFPRVQAFSQEPLYLGNYLLIPISVFISLFLAKINIKKIPRLILFFIIVALIIILGLTVSRGAYLALAASLFVIFVFMARRFFAPKIIATILVAIVIGSGAMYWFLSKSEDRALEEFVGHVTVQDFEESESVNGRILEYQKAIKLAEGNEITGVGIGGYGVYKNRAEVKPEDTEDYDIVNNQYIELYTETGIVGLISFAFFLLVVIWRSIIAFYACQDKFVKFVLVGLLAAFIGTLVQYNFFSTFYIIHIWILIGLLVATQTIAFKYEKN